MPWGGVYRSGAYSPEDYAYSKIDRNSVPTCYALRLESRHSQARRAAYGARVADPSVAASHVDRWPVLTTDEKTVSSSHPRGCTSCISSIKMVVSVSTSDSDDPSSRSQRSSLPWCANTSDSVRGSRRVNVEFKVTFITCHGCQVMFNGP